MFQIKKSLKKNIIVIKDWNELVNKGEIKPTAKKFILTIFKLGDSIKSSEQIEN